MICEERGLDPNKRVNVHRRQLVVDTQGRLWVAYVHRANQANGPAGCALVSYVLWRVGERLEKVLGDQAARRSDWFFSTGLLSILATANGPGELRP